MKYELTAETKVAFGVTFHRIKALIDISIWGVVKGDLGGWVQKVENLDQDTNAWVSGDARVFGDARVSGMEALCAFVGFGSAFRQTTAYLDAKMKIRVSCGCFTGTVEEFRAQIIETHGSDSKNGKLYLGMVNMIEVRLGNVEIPK